MQYDTLIDHQLVAQNIIHGPISRMRKPTTQPLS